MNSLHIVPPPVGHVWGWGSNGWGSVGVAQHGVEGAGEVVVVGAAVILLSDGHQTRQTHDEQQQELQRQSRPQDPQQEGLAASRSSATAWPGGTTARGSARRNPGGPEHESDTLMLISRRCVNEMKCVTLLVEIHVRKFYFIFIFLKASTEKLQSNEKNRFNTELRAKKQQR